MALVQVLLLLTTILQLHPALSLGSHYNVCPAGQVHGGQHLATASGRSTADCAALCSRTEGCEALNVCPDHLSGATTCSLLADRNSQGCVGLIASSGPECRYAEKRSGDNICQNGGTLVGESCACPIQYSGSLCQRLIRDCTEAFQNGHKSTSENGVYFIQPAKAPSPFQVRCTFSNGGITVPFRRTNAPFNVSWAEAVTGFGGDLTVPPDDKNFFIGLDNLHHLSSQAGYNAQFFMKYNNWSGSGGAFYSGWTIGPASSNYSLTYTQYYANSNQPADNGLGSQLPLLFATPDHDVAGCASVRGWPGWFGADCSGYSVFADNPTWPFNGTDGVLDMVVLYMVKKTAYFDEK